MSRDLGTKLNSDSDTNNPHLIDRYIVSKIKGSRYLVTNGDNSFSISGKSEADTLCDTLNTKIDSIMEAMCTLTGDWSGCVMTITSMDQVAKLVNKNIAFQDDNGSNVFYTVCLDKDDIKTVRRSIKNDPKHNEFEESYNGRKIIHLGDIFKRLGLPEDTELYN